MISCRRRPSWPRLNVMAQGGSQNRFLGTAAQRRFIRDPALRYDTTWALPYWCADVPHLCLEPIPSHASAGGRGQSSRSDRRRRLGIDAGP
jgi:hypothetical protein